MKLEQGLSQQLNQFQVQSLKILSFDNYELEKFLQDEYAENPLMEHKESGKEFFTLHGNAGGYQDIEQSDIEDKKIEDPEAFFMEQLNAKDYTKKEWNVMKYMAQCLEESGLLLVSTKEISHKLGIEEKDCERLLDHLKQLEPAGVFAESVSECLLLQLEREGLLNDDLRYIVENYLEDIAMGHLSTVSRALDIKTSQVRKYIFKIQELNPRPLSGYTGGTDQYIVPDILMEKDGEELKIRLNDDWIGDYSINDYYVKMMEQAEDSELKEYFRKKYERCRFIITSIEQRRETMLKISKAILDRQREYFMNHKQLKPMTMQNVADDIEMHVSTVSRAVKGKYIQYPGGTIGMRDIFNNTQTFGDQDSTTEEIKEEIRRLVKEEDKKKPLSDSKIVSLLEQKNMKISRRTVAKYRAQLGIAGTTQRKIHE